MSTRLRSSSVGAKPRPRLHRPSRSESAAALALDVRCACQFYETKSLLPERVNPVGYNTAEEEFGPCVHVNARLKNRDEVIQHSRPELGFVATPSRPMQPMTVANKHSNAYELPPEFAPETSITESMENKASTISALGNRSVSCNNMGARPPTPQFMKQRDPSTSSLLRKRMSEERQGFSVLNKRASQSTASRDRFIAQKDLSQSTILKRKMYNQSASFDRANSETIPSERFQSFKHFQTNQTSNKSTFYHDSSEFICDPPVEAPVQVASPLSMQSQGNRRFILSSTENLPTKPSTLAKMSTETEPDSGIESNFIDDTPRKAFLEKQTLKSDRSSHAGQNVSDEEKVQFLLSSKSKHLNSTKKDAFDLKPTPLPVEVRNNEMSFRPVLEKQKLQLMNVDDAKHSNSTTKKDAFDLKPTPVPIEVKNNEMSFRPVPNKQKLQLMKVDDVKTVEMPTHSELQIQYVAKVDSTWRPQEAETSDYSYSKLFDNYKSSPLESNISTPDLRFNYIRQRDPSRSPFTQNRYKTLHNTTPTPLLSTDVKASQEKLLPPAGDYPERRASETFSPQMNPHIIRQKDLSTSNVLNRRQRNLSQTSLGHDIGMDDVHSQPIKITKTISFEKSLARSDADHISPYTGTSVKMAKGVSFEFDRPLPSDRNERNMFDFSHMSASRRPYR